ncbi:MAG: hypothetical protein ACR2HR_15655, partial [Euzebya sp.]
MVVIVAVVALLTGVAGTTRPTGSDPAAQPELVTDLQTEDAVISLLQLYEAEVALVRAVGQNADAFSLPGP